MVKTALLYPLAGKFVRLQEGLNLQRQFGRARRVVSQGVEPGAEVAEVVHRRVLRGCHQQRFSREAVGRDRQDRPRPSKGLLDSRSQALHEGADLAGLERRHG